MLLGRGHPTGGVVAGHLSVSWRRASFHPLLHAYSLCRVWGEKKEGPAAAAAIVQKRNSPEKLFNRRMTKETRHI